VLSVAKNIMKKIVLLLVLCFPAVASARVETVRFQSKFGDHSWGYWDRQVQEILKIAARKMRLPPNKPLKGSRA
jgi:hypothetical protein